MLLCYVFVSSISCIFFFKQKTAYEMRISDWSSDVCSSDLGYRARAAKSPRHRGSACPSRHHPLPSSSPCPFSVLDCFDDDEGLRPGMVVGQRQMDMRGVTRGSHLREPFGGAAGERERRRARGGVDDADVLHKHAALEAGADGLGEGFFRGEQLGGGDGAGEGAARSLGTLDVGEDAVLDRKSVL